MVILLLLGYVSSKNYSIGLLLMGAFFATLFTMQKHQVNDKIVSVVILDSIKPTLVGINSGVSNKSIMTFSFLN